MADKFPKLYDLKKTTVVFTFAGLFLFVSLVAMVLQDSTREWKSYQRRFMEYMRGKTSAEIEAAEKTVDRKKQEELGFLLKTAQETLAARHDEFSKIEKNNTAVDIEYTRAKTRYQDLKQRQESDRYFFEEAREHKDEKKAAYFRGRMEKRASEFEASRLEMEAAETRKEGGEEALRKLSENVENAQKEIAAFEKELNGLRRREKKLEFDWIKAVLSAPMLDFIRPPMQIQQIVVEDLHDDYYFSRPQKVDRCITCHLGIDQKGLEGAPAPFKSHPRLDLFLSSNSPHPMESFGCTTCHGGSGHSVSFTTASHTPRNEEQARAWEKKYHWHPMKHWSDKMLPANHMEAACAKCHNGVSVVPQAPKLNEGRQLAQTFGCFGCHTVQGFEKAWKAGPGLEHVQSKLDQDWIVRWLQNPRDFRPSTKMPRIFHLSNTSDPESAEKSNAAIAGIAAYLIKNSEPVSLSKAPVPGDAVNGEKLIREIGCLGCHTAAGASANDHGPELTGMGSKVKPEWLFTWLKDPKHYYAGTRMPNMRLSDQEAADIAAYLLSLRNEKFESLQAPRVKPEIVDDMVLTYLKGSMRQEQAKAEMAGMSADQRLELIGKKAIAHQGCFGCHNIKGFEDAKPVGTELTEEGSKEVDKLSFGFADIPKTRQAWFFQKLKEPRIFDHGKDVSYLEKLRMPQFDFTDQQAESLVTFLLSQQRAHIPLSMQKRLDLREQHVETGRHMVQQFNCNGCHTLDGVEGRARKLFADIGNAPPAIDGEGRKVQPEWLYHFLGEPATIRPWLKYRMPTFGFDGSELSALVQYFNDLDKVPPVYDRAKPAASAGEIEAGHKLFQTFQCIKCHKSNPEPGLTASFLAPDLAVSKERLRPEWVSDWIREPQLIQPGTMMPTFFADGQSPATDILGGDAGRQIKAMRDYLWVFEPEETRVSAVKS